MASWGTRRQDPLVAGEYRQDSVMEQALQCARQAVIAEPLLAEAHAQLGWCLHSVYRRHEAMEAYRRAFELNGCLTDRRYGLMLTHGGRHDEAIAFMQRAARRDPFQGPFHSSFGADPHYLIGQQRNQDPRLRAYGYGRRRRRRVSASTTKRVTRRRLPSVSTPT
jgi:tetratricopeptide (TPR) repeat protein